MTVLNQLIGLGVPVAIKVVYEEGVPVSRSLMALLVTKRDRFYRINGQIVSRSVAFAAMRQGIAEFS